jgi:hypothetical protein
MLEVKVNYCDGGFGKELGGGGGKFIGGMPGRAPGWGSGGGGATQGMFTQNGEKLQYQLLSVDEVQANIFIM